VACEPMNNVDTVGIEERCKQLVFGLAVVVVLIECEDYVACYSVGLGAVEYEVSIPRQEFWAGSIAGESFSGERAGRVK